MPVFQLDERLVFPPPELADPDGLLAVGGDLRPERILLGYSQGIFPWPAEGFPLLWHSPDPRFVLWTEQLHVPRSLAKFLKRRRFELSLDRRFSDVIARCAQKPRPGQQGTWITEEMVDAYGRLHRLGYAHSLEVHHKGELVGGLYGVSLGGAFFGESMFSRVDDASGVAFVILAEQLARWDIGLIDCQVETRHLARFGARSVPRESFIELLRSAIRKPTRRGRWVLAPQEGEVLESDSGHAAPDDQHKGSVIPNS